MHTFGRKFPVCAGEPDGTPRRPSVVRLTATLLAATFLMAATLLAGQAPARPAPPANPLKLTLRGAVAMALRQNPQVQIGALDLAKSQQNRKLAISALLPQASLDVNDEAVRSNVEADFGRPLPVPGVAEHIGPFQIFNAGALFSAPVFDLSLWRRLQASGQAVTESGYDRLGVREQVTLLVVSQYLASLRDTATVRAARARVALAQALYDQAQDLQKHGVSTGLDTLRANVELQNEQQILIQAETAEKTSLYALARLLNVSPGVSLVLADRMSFYQTPPFTAAQSLAQALANRPEMKSLEARQWRLQDELRAASDQKFPTLSFQGQYFQQGISASTAIPTYLYEARVDFPLFTGGRIRAQEANARLDLAVLAQQKTDFANQIALEVKTAVANLQAALHEVQVATLGVALARQEVSQSRDRFQAGVADNIEVVSAQDALARANSNQIGALYRYNEARAELARATGQIENVYMK